MRYLMIALCLLFLSVASVSSVLATAGTGSHNQGAVIADNTTPQPMLDGIDWDEWLMLDGIDWDEWLMHLFGPPPVNTPQPPLPQPPGPVHA